MTKTLTTRLQNELDTMNRTQLCLFLNCTRIREIKCADATRKTYYRQAAQQIRKSIQAR